jgi:Type I restriction-modification system methyltransferase subunit
MTGIQEEIKRNLKKGPEQKMVVGPIVKILIDSGWDISQIMYGKDEWKIPKNPSEASKREMGQMYDYFPVDIAVFDDEKTRGDYRHILFIIECKQPDINVGLSQLETYLSLEPHAKLGIWTNASDTSADALFVYKDGSGLNYPIKSKVRDIPSTGAPIAPSIRKIRFNDLFIPSNDALQKVFSDLLDIIVARDGNVTRREEQLDQLCDIILLKLDSDKHGKIEPEGEVYFRSLSTSNATGKHIKDRFRAFNDVYPDIFITESDKELRLSNNTIHTCVEYLSRLNIIDVGPEAVSIAFQVLRSAALKQEEGQYFTPKPVIESAVKLMNITLDDIIIDPACGTGGFIIQCLIELKKRYPLREKEVSKWAQLHLFGIDKDAIGVKLTKAIMQILDDGSAHCVRGDSVLTHTWPSQYPHLLSNQFKNGRFTKIFTNPPFGSPLKIDHADILKSGLSILKYMDSDKDVELGLVMFNRCCDLLRTGGMMCIVLPETYFFSPSYKFVRKWMKDNLRPIRSVNIPMDAFQGYCRAKTNLYIFEKIEPRDDKEPEGGSVHFSNPSSCGIYKNGSVRYKVNDAGSRTSEVDNELMDVATAFENNTSCIVPFVDIPLKEVFSKDIIVPRYYDNRYDVPFEKFIKKENLESISLGELLEIGILEVKNGHGSPSNDLRNGTVPYIKVSDVRNMRININPTNLIPLTLAQKFWRTKNGKSNLREWDLISPNRASSNIGEFSILLPGEEQIVLTKEMFVFRVNENEEGYNPFYLLWALSLLEVREQWKRVVLMQTNREDVGNRYKEIKIPKPKSAEWAEVVSTPFKDHFILLANSKKKFIECLEKDRFAYIANVRQDI